MTDNLKTADTDIRGLLVFNILSLRIDLCSELLTPFVNHVPTHIVAGVFQLTEKVVNDVTAMVGVDESQGIQAPSLLVGGAWGGVFGQVGGH